MTPYNWLSLFGVPALFLALFTGAYRFLLSRVKRSKSETDALKTGLRALLRDRLYELYRECRRAGGATRLERESFACLYKQYRALGGNGVLRDLRSKFLSLPIKLDD